MYPSANILTYSMVQSPSWETTWFAASQEIPHISRNPKVHYRTHKRPPTVSLLGQPNPVHIPTSQLLEIRPNIIHPSTPRSLQWSPSLRFLPPQDPIHPPLTHTRHMPSPSHTSRFYHPKILGEEYKSISSSLCNLPHSLVTSSLLGPNILLNTMFSNTLSFLSSRNVSDQVSHHPSANIMSCTAFIIDLPWLMMIAACPHRKARLRLQASPYKIYSGQRGTGTGFSPCTLVLPYNHRSTSGPHSNFIQPPSITHKHFCSLFFSLCFYWNTPRHSWCR